MCLGKYYFWIYTITGFSALFEVYTTIIYPLELNFTLILFSQRVPNLYSIYEKPFLAWVHKIIQSFNIHVTSTPPPRAKEKIWQYNKAAPYPHARLLNYLEWPLTAILQRLIFHPTDEESTSESQSRTPCEVFIWHISKTTDSSSLLKAN